MLSSYYTPDLRALNVFGVIEDSIRNSPDPLTLLTNIKKQIRKLEEDLENRK